VYLGSDAFVERVQQEIDEEQSLDDTPKPQRLAPVKPLSFYETHYPERDESLARAWLDGHYSLEAIGRHFGVSRTTVSRAVKAFRVKCEV
jgi:AraC-like DNA-binding protein